MAVTTKTKVSDAFKGITPGQTYAEFVGNKGAKEFNEAIRDTFTSHYLKLDMSKKTLLDVGWSKLEAKFLNKAFKELSSNYAKEEFITLDRVNDTLFISGGTKTIGSRTISKPFKVQTPIFKEVAAKASDLLKNDYPRARTLSHKELSDAIDALEGKRIPEDDTKLRSLAYSRLFGIATGVKDSISTATIDPKTKENLTAKQVTKYKLMYSTHGGHLEGHENYKLAAATRFIIGAVGTGANFIPDSILQKLQVKLKMNEETIITIKKFVAGKIDTNEFTGALITQNTTMELASKNISKKEEQIQAELLATELAKLYEDWVKVRSKSGAVVKEMSSPSILQRIEAFLATILTDGEAKIKRADKYKPKSKKPDKTLTFNLQNDKVKLSKAIQKAKRISLKKELNELERRLNTDTVDTLNIKNLINGILAERVEAEMAKSGSSDGRLRYQTGRFAESANLLTLTRTQAGVLAGTYTYLRNPYDVFLPGHKMGTPKRDPRIYVEGAIRKSAMQLLKQRFPGISLELK